MKQQIVLGMLALTFSAAAGVPQNSYGIIVERNSFGLRPPPSVKPAEPEPLPAPSLPEVRITGITTLLGRPIVTLQYEDKETKTVEFPPLLIEGATYKKLVVEKIDTERQVVIIRNGGTLETLDFVNDGVKPKAAAARPPATPPINSPVPPGVVSTVNASSGNRVLISGAGTVSGATRPVPVMPPERIRAYLEELRQKQQMQRQSSAVHPAGTGLRRAIAAPSL